MNSLQKKLRYYWWLLRSFVVKNIKLITVSSIISFFFIFAFVNFFPFINTFFLKKHDRIGIVGRFNISNLKALPVEITGLLSNPLISVNEKGELMPVLVNSWEIIDGKNYRLHLKTSLYWSDGARFRASDIDLQFKGIKRKVIDESTIEFQLSQPLSNFPVYLTKPLIKYPLKGVAGLYQIQTLGVDNNNLTALSLFPNKKNLPFKTYHFYGSEDDLVTAFKKGEINIIKTSKKSIADIFRSWKNTSVKRGINYNQILTVFFNTGKGMTSDRDFRKVLVQAIPDFDEYGEKALTPIPPTSWAYSDKVRRYTYDFDKAKSVFQKNKSATDSGRLNIYTFYDYVRPAESIRKNYEKMGLKTSLKILSYLPQDFDALITLWSPPTDPDQYYFWHSTQREENITNYKNVKVDKLLEDGRKITDLDERIDIYREFQKVIMEDVPAYFLYYPYVYTIVRK